MKICIAVSEFNPFHNGHAAFLKNCRALTGADAVVCAMAGNFTQRGELAVMEKRARAQIALSQGADGVIELPTPVAVANAERFALGAVALFRGVKADLCLCCGSEVADTPLLTLAADFFSAEPKAYRKWVKTYLKQGLSLPKARENALLKVGKAEFVPLITNPNATLALEYAKACKRAKIPFYTYPRTGSYHDEALPQNTQAISGTAIRTAIANGEQSALAPYLPQAAFSRLPARLPCIDEGLFLTLLSKTKKQLSRLPDCTEGLENRIYRSLRESTTMEGFLEKVKTKRYVMSRIKRITACALLGVEEGTARATAKRAPYLRVLGVKKGAEGLLAALSTANAPLLMKRKDAEKLKGYAKKSFLADERGEAAFRFAQNCEYPFFVKE